MVIHLANINHDPWCLSNIFSIGFPKTAICTIQTNNNCQPYLYIGCSHNFSNRDMVLEKVGVVPVCDRDGCWNGNPSRHDGLTTSIVLRYYSTSYTGLPFEFP